MVETLLVLREVVSCPDYFSPSGREKCGWNETTRDVPWQATALHFIVESCEHQVQRLVQVPGSAESYL